MIDWWLCRVDNDPDDMLLIKMIVLTTSVVFCVSTIQGRVKKAWEELKPILCKVLYKRQYGVRVIHWKVKSKVKREKRWKESKMMIMMREKGKLTVYFSYNRKCYFEMKRILKGKRIENKERKSYLGKGQRWEREKVIKVNMKHLNCGDCFPL